MIRRPWKTTEIAMIRDHGANMTSDELSEKLNRTPRAIEQRASDCNLKLKSIPTKRRYFAEDVADMMELSDMNVGRVEIARKYRTSSSAISMLLMRAKKHGFDRYPKRK